MAVLKLQIFSSMIAWKMSIGLCIKNTAMWKNLGGGY